MWVHVLKMRWFIIATLIACVASSEPHIAEPCEFHIDEPREFHIDEPREFHIDEPREPREPLVEPLHEELEDLEDIVRLAEQADPVRHNVQNPSLVESMSLAYI